MKKSAVLKEVIFFNDCPEIDYSTISVECSNLNTYILEGNSTFLLSEKKSHEKNPFGCFLGFNLQIENFDIQSQPFNQDKLTSIAPKISKNNTANDEEEVLEIKYPSNPTKFSELASFEMLVITNSEYTAKLCHFVEISYYFTLKELDKDLISSLLETNPVDLLFIDSKYEEKDSNKIIENIEKLLGLLKGMTPFVRCILPLQSTLHEKALTRNIQSLNSDLLKQIIPSQTWQFSQGEIKYDPNTELAVSIMINHKVNRNRKDKINSIKDYSDPNTFKTFGGGSVYSSSIIREISFELEKLPKFGA